MSARVVRLAAALCLAAALVVPPGASDTAGFGSGTFDVVGLPFCDDPVVFSMVEVGADDWRFTLVDRNLASADCVFANVDVLVASGSPSSGFSGDVVSGPWTVTGSSFTTPMMTLHVSNVVDTYDLKGTASGQLFG